MKKTCFGLRLCRGLRFTTRRDYKIPPPLEDSERADTPSWDW